MANCMICGDKLPMMGGKYISSLNGKICDHCFDNARLLRATYHGNPQAEQYKGYFEKYLEKSLPQNVREYINLSFEEHKNNVPDENQSSGLIESSNFKYMTGIPGWPEKMIHVTADLYDDHITLHWTAYDNSPVAKLAVSQITETEYLSEKEVIEKSKSVVGRAGVGLLFGPLGAVVGGMSGIGSKQQVKYNSFYIIHFINQQGEEAIISLGSDCMGCHWSKFDAALKKLIRPAGPSIDKVTIL